MRTENIISIVGTGGFGKEVYNCLIQTARIQSFSPEIEFVVDDAFFNEAEFCGCPVNKLSAYSFEDKTVLIAVGDPVKRSELAARIGDVYFGTLIHPSAIIGENVLIGAGTIITQHVVITCDVRIGMHCHLNLGSTIGHDCLIGDYFTTAPAVNVSGNCVIGNRVYLGTGCGVREKIVVTDDVTAGMGSMIVKNIDLPGTYTGIPATKITK